MSIIDIKYFRWNPDLASLDVNLGDSKQTLLKEGLIKEVKLVEGVEYTGVNDVLWRVDFSEDAVSGIWFNRDGSFKINGVEILRECYENIKPILESNFQSLNSEIRNVEEMKSYQDSNVLLIKCKDLFVTTIGIVKTKSKIH